MTAANGPALSRRARTAWAAPGLLALLALCACSGTRRLVLFERDDGTGADGGRARDAGCAACAAAIALDGGTPGPLHGGDSGTARTDLCPGEQVLIGYLGKVQDIGTSASPLSAIGSLQGLCGALELGPQRAVRVVAGSELPVRGEPEPAQLAAFEQRCPADQVVVGIEGRAGIALDRIAFVCASLQARESDGGIAFARVDEAALPAAGGDGGSAFADGCPPGSLARGQQLRDGRWIDAFGLVCAAPLALPPDPGQSKN